MLLLTHNISKYFIPRARPLFYFYSYFACVYINFFNTRKGKGINAASSENTFIEHPVFDKNVPQLAKVGRTIQNINKQRSDITLLGNRFSFSNDSGIVLKLALAALCLL